MNLSDSLTGCAPIEGLIAAWAQVLQDAAPAAARARTAEQARELATLSELLALERDPDVWSSLVSSLHTAVVEASSRVCAEAAVDELWRAISTAVDLAERTWVCRGAIDEGLASLVRTIAGNDAQSAERRMRQHLDILVPELSRSLYRM